MPRYEIINRKQNFAYGFENWQTAYAYARRLSADWLHPWEVNRVSGVNETRLAVFVGGERVA